MTGLRAKVSGALDRAGLLDRMLWLRARAGRRGLAVVTYHRVGGADRAGELDPGLFEALPRDLEEQLAVLRSRCTVVSIADVRRFARGSRLPPNPVLVTFDDGYVEGHDVALPILRRAGVPATFFISTAYPDAGRLFWWDRVWLTMHRSREERVELDYPRPLSLRPRDAKEASARLVCQAIKRTPGIDLPRLWGALEAAAKVSLDAAEERAIARRTIMGFRLVRALRDAGMDVQSHAHEHLVLNTLTPDRALLDLARSRDALRDAIGGDIYAVAYPVGYPLTGALRDAPIDAGFELGFTNGSGRAGASVDPLGVPRLSMDLDIALPDYKLRLLFGARSRAPSPLMPRAPGG